jgi:prepilin-type N-terminal cleavage/methylation domain-containing protein
MVNALKKRLRFEKGITLTELMIVVVIIGFLALLAFWASRTQVFKGYDARRKSDIRMIKIAIEEYEKDHDCYPMPQLVLCDQPVGNPGTGLRPYLDKIPCDPRTGASYYYEYEDSACPKWYRLYAALENTRDKDYLGPVGPGGSFNYYSGSPNSPSGTTSPSVFYGCQSGSCVSIGWDDTRPGPACDPNYGNSTCYGQCRDVNGTPINECLPWQ